MAKDNWEMYERTKKELMDYEKFSVAMSQSNLEVSPEIVEEIEENEQV